MRTGIFTSSSIWKLMTNDRKGTGFGSPALTYIEEKRMENRLGRSLTSETHSRPTDWGNFLEKRAFDLLGLEYQLESKTRYVHSEVPEWSGMPDLVTGTKVGDIKCCFTLKSFCQLVDACSQGIEAFKEHSPEYFYQLVSNAILTGKSTIELVVYVPYKTELSEIKEEAMADPKCFINYVSESELPYLIEGNFYKNLNVFTFEVDKKDIDALTTRVKEAVVLLNK